MKELLSHRIFSTIADITQMETDAVVNAANSTLLGGGGVDGAIHQAGGPEILEACRKIRTNEYRDGLPPGAAAATTAGKMPARWVIHTVGPVWHGGKQEEDITLRNAYKNSLFAADELKCRSVSFPAISTGVYGFPKDRAARLAWQSVKEFLQNEAEYIEKVYFVFFSEKDEKIFIDALKLK
ncbi:MAG: O-acetyl-ADP-ribose deacetylase [Spirochaetia bacterium]|nr:O-acetyl-ADP-ribose deacetylase [Spirochaetia bacterium]